MALRTTDPLGAQPDRWRPAARLTPAPVGAGQDLPGPLQWLGDRIRELLEAQPGLTPEDARAQALAELHGAARRAPPAPSLVPEPDLLARYQLDPGQRLQELGATFQRQPLHGALQTLFLPFEALATGVQTLGGLGLGLYQSGQQRFGWDLGARLGTLLAESAEAPGAALPLVGGPLRLATTGLRAGLELPATVLPALGSTLAGTAPEPVVPPLAARVAHYGPFGSVQFPAETPVLADDLGTTLAAARARYQTLLPPPVQFLGELAAPAGLAGRVGAAGSAALQAGATGALRALWPSYGRLRALPSGVSTAQAALGEALELVGSPAGRLATRVGLPAGLALESLRTPEPPEAEPATPLEQLTRAGVSAFAGLLGGALIQHLAQTGSRALLRPRPLAWPPAEAPKDAASLLQTLQATRAAQDELRLGGFHPDPALVPRAPGGVLGQTLRQWSRAWLDELAPLESFSAPFRARPPEQVPANLARLVPGAPAAARAHIEFQIRPLFREAGLTADHLPAFDTYRHLRLGPQLLARGIPTAPFISQAEARETRRAIRDELRRARTTFLQQLRQAEPDLTPAQRNQRWAQELERLQPVVTQRHYAPFIDRAEEARRLFERDLDAQFGPGTAQRFARLTDQLTDRINPILDVLEEAGLLPPGGAAHLRATVPVYATLNTLEALVDPLLPGPPPPRFGAVMTGLGEFHPSRLLPDRPPARPLALFQRLLRDPVYITPEVNLWRDLLRLERLYLLAARNRVARQVARLGTLYQLPDIQPWRAYRTPQPAGEARVPPGWGRVPYFDNGQYREILATKELADTLLGLGVGEADLVTRGMGRFGQFFRQAITTWSLPFHVGNFFRDLGLALTARGGNARFLDAWLRSWIELLGEPIPDWLNRLERAPRAQHAVQRMLTELTALFLRPPLQLAAAARARALGPHGPLREEYYRAGAGLGTFTEQVRAGGGAFTAAAALALPGTPRPWWDRGPLAVLTKPAQAVELMGQLIELAPRLAAYRLAREQGAPPLRAAIFAREGHSIDFGRGGTAAKVLNLWLPLLNARIQGTLRGLRAMESDPFGYAFRAYLWLGVPTVLTYAWNRLFFEDVYDQIPTDIRNRHAVVVIGRWYDAYGQPRPLYVQIPLDESVALLKAPLEHLLDAQYHLRHETEPLEGAQRTGRTAAQLWLQTLANLLPFGLQADDLQDPASFVIGVLSMNPVVGTAAQLWANSDRFLNRAITPEELRVLPAAYQYTPRTTLLSRLLGRVLHAPPTTFDFAVRGLGGTAALWYWGAFDWLARPLLAAGLLPADLALPPRAEDLQLPPGTDPKRFQAALDALNREDWRPWYARFLPRLLGTASGQQALVAIERGLSGVERQRVQDTRRAAADLATFRAEQQATRLQREQPGSALTHAQLRERRAQDQAAYRQYVQDVLRRYPHAVVQPQEREALYRTLPRLPVARFLQESADVGVPPGELLARFEQLRDQLAAARARGPEDLPAAREAAAQQAIAQLSQELGRAPGVVRDALAAALLGRDVPALGVPALDLEVVVSEWLAPEGVDFATAPPDAIGAARRAVVQRAAERWGVPYEDLWRRIQLRLAHPGEQTPLSLSLERALAVANRIHDPQQVPTFADATGRPWGTPEQWPGLLLARDRALALYGSNRRQWPVWARAIDTAWRWGQVARLRAALQDPDYLDYQRWYGIGRDMSVAEWERFMSGHVTRYRAPITPQQALQWDALRLLYNALPAEARGPLRPLVRMINQLAIPRWRALLDREGQRWGELEPAPEAPARGMAEPEEGEEEALEAEEALSRAQRAVPFAGLDRR